MNKKIEVNCPHCNTKFEYYQSKFRPFCCEKCKLIDLGQWINEEYKVAGSEPAYFEDDDQRIINEIH